jgi:hypothetical protein
MKKIDSGILIEHIEEAKDWLNKAKDEYSQANPVRGELILNLAQAEVKYAWELSHRQFVSTKRELIRNRKINYLVPAAASVIIILGLVFWPRVAKISLDSKQPAPAKTQVFTVAKTEVVKPDNVKPELAKVQPSLQMHVVAPVVVAFTSQPVSTVKPDPIQVAEVKTTSPAETVVSEKQRKEKETIRNQSNLQPVSQLSFDEEALAKEASHSLRNGK